MDVPGSRERVSRESSKRPILGNVPRGVPARAMGACGSSPPCVGPDAARAAEAELGVRELASVDVLTQGSLSRLYRLFKSADVDGIAGEADARELARMFRLREDHFASRLVDILDRVGDRAVDFRRFVVGLAAFVLAGAFARVRFSFRLFDLDDDGVVTRDDLLVAMRASEARREAARAHAHRRAAQRASRRISADFWGDTAPQPPSPPSREEEEARASRLRAVEDLASRCPSRMRYDDFVLVVTRHPRAFAPVNHLWSALRPFADPAVSVVRHLRRQGDAEFFRGTALERGRRPDDAFAPPSRSSPGFSAGSSLRDPFAPDAASLFPRMRGATAGGVRIDRPGAWSRGRPGSKEAAMRGGAGRGPGGGRFLRNEKSSAGDDSDVDSAPKKVGGAGAPSGSGRFGAWLLDAARGASAPRDALAAAGWRHDTPSPRSEARTASECVAEEQLEADARRLGLAFGGRGRPRGSRPGDADAPGDSDSDDSDDSGDEDARTDATMREIWEALRRAPNPTIGAPPRRSSVGGGHPNAAADRRARPTARSRGDDSARGPGPGPGPGPAGERAGPVRVPPLAPGLGARLASLDPSDPSTIPDSPSSSAKVAIRCALAEAAAAAPVPRNYGEVLDVAAVAKRATAARRGRENLMRFKAKAERARSEASEGNPAEGRGGGGRRAGGGARGSGEGGPRGGAKAPPGSRSRRPVPVALAGPSATRPPPPPPAAARATRASAARQREGRPMSSASAHRDALREETRRTKRAAPRASDAGSSAGGSAAARFRERVAAHVAAGGDGEARRVYGFER